MSESQWRDLTHMLSKRARRGDQEAIRKWLADWNRTEGVEAVVWIDHSVRPRQAKAGTAGLVDKVPFPPSLMARLNDAGSRIELWHNHPKKEGEPALAVPSPDDIGTLMRPGVITVGAIATETGETEERWIQIDAGARQIPHPQAITSWVRYAQNIEIATIDAELGPPADAEAKRSRSIWTAEVAVGAAEAMGLLQSKGLKVEARANGIALARATNGSFGTPKQIAERTPMPETDETALKRTTTRERQQWQGHQYHGRSQ